MQGLHAVRECGTFGEACVWFHPGKDVMMKETFNSGE